MYPKSRTVPLPVPPVVDARMKTRGAGLRKGRPVAVVVVTIPAGSIAAQSARVTGSITRSMLSTSASRASGRRPCVCKLRGML